MNDWWLIIDSLVTRKGENRPTRIFERDFSLKIIISLGKTWFASNWKVSVTAKSHKNFSLGKISNEISMVYFMKSDIFVQL